MKPRSFEICLAASLLGLSPLLAVQCGHLWERPHFQFFPLAWLALIALLVTRAKVGPVASHARVRWGLGLWVCGLAIGLVGGARFSPWLGHVAALLCITAWGLLRLESVPWIRWLGWTLLLWVTLPLPGNLDRELVSGLQTISTESAGALLDLVGLVHLRQGNLIEIRAGQLFVDEACSGIDSLYALFAIALIMMLWQRRPLVVGLFTLLSVPVWAWLGNVMRLTLIVWLLDRWHIDLSQGWKHSALGLVMFALSSVCLFVTLGAFTNLFKRFSTGAMPRDRKSWHLAYNAVVCFPGKAPELAGEEDAYFASSRPKVAVQPPPKKSFTQAYDPKKVRALQRALFSMAIIAPLLIAGLSVRAMARSENSFIPGLPHFEVADVDQAFSESAMPETLQGAKRVAFVKEERSLDNFFGEYSRTWKYIDEKGEFILSADFPFRGFHALWACYTSVGNEVVGEPAKLQLPTTGTVQATDEPSVARVKFKDELGYTSYLWFSMFEASGRPIEVADYTEDTRAMLVERLLGGDASAFDAEAVTFQFQLYVQSGSDLNAAQLDRYLTIYAEALPYAVEQVKRLNAK